MRLRRSGLPTTDVPSAHSERQTYSPSTASWEDKLRLDVDYVDHHSFMGDLKIIIDSAGSVARRDGISAAGEVTMSEFLGTRTVRKTS